MSCLLPRRLRLRDAAKQLAGRNAQAASDLEDGVQSRIAASSFDPGDLGLMQAGRPGQLFLGQAGVLARQADVVGEGLALRGRGFVGHPPMLARSPESDPANLS
jgi:hypothetical protein